MRKAIQHLRAADPVIKSIIDRVGPFRPRYIEPGFEALVRSIVYQQLSGKVAAVIFARLRAAAGDPVTAEGVLALSDEAARAVGLSRQKLLYLRDIAARTAEGSVDFTRLPSLSSDRVMECLTQCKGVGPWTVHMFLIFALRRPDVLPTGDLGVREAIRRAYQLPALPKPVEVEALAEPWRPYASVASWYLWRSLDAEAALD